MQYEPPNFHGVMLDSMPAPASYWDSNGLNRYANPAFLAWSGAAQGGTVGRHAREVFASSWSARLDAAFAEALAGRSHQLVIARPGCDEMRTDLRFMPDRQDGQVRGVILFACDVTAARGTPDEQRFAEQLEALASERERREASDRANKAKTDFLASMSHEIRTPMNAILGLSYLALQYGLEDKPRGYVQKVHRAAENLLGILNDILDFSKVEAGQMQLEHQPFALADVLDRVMETAGVKAQAKELQFTLKVEPQVPKELLGDALRVGQVLLNLCDNAIKFTERGQVVVHVESMLQLGKRTELIFSVADTGPGIASEAQGLIFRQFAQADASVARNHGGTGLGLSICRQLVNLMGGHLGVQSQVGSGSTFHFNALFETNPAAASEADSGPAGTDDATAQSADVLRGAKVLLVEDNEVNQLVACEMLRGAGVEVLVAENGQRALDILKAQPDLDLVLMDCHMPVMDGFAATRAIRSHAQFHDLPVVAMTANVLAEDLLKCRGVGMNDYVGKPFLVNDLFEVLTRWLAAGRSFALPTTESKFTPIEDT